MSVLGWVSTSQGKDRVRPSCSTEQFLPANESKEAITYGQHGLAHNKGAQVYRFGIEVTFAE